MKRDTSRHDPRADKRRPKRQAKYVASGRQIACVIRDRGALDALRKLEMQRGGVTAAVTHALKQSAV